MGSKRHRPRDNQLAERYRAGDFDPEKMFEKDDDKSQRFSDRSKNAVQDKIEKTTAARTADELENPVTRLFGQVRQVYSLYCDVVCDGKLFLCTTRKTLNKSSATQIVVGDNVRFIDNNAVNEAGQQTGVIELAENRETVLTRSDSFKGNTQHPIVANAQQMLIVASAREPAVKWGLVDRMIIAAKSGGLTPIVCLNKIDLLDDVIPSTDAAATDELIDPRAVLSHYLSLGVQTLETSVQRRVGLGELDELIAKQITVLAGHSGVGKSSLIRAIRPNLDIRIAPISSFTGKGRHTTTSARWYAMDDGGALIDTPGVKLFGLWGVRKDNLIEFFPDVENQTAPKWRQTSYARIAGTL